MATTERSGLTGLKHACKECGTPLGFEGCAGNAEQDITEKK